MKRLLFIVMAATADPGAAQEPVVQETARWLAGVAEFGPLPTGDNRSDVVLVDRHLGTLTVGMQRADGGFDWGQPTATGFVSPESLALGRPAASVLFRLALSDRLANRVSLFDPAVVPAGSGIRHVFPSGPMPRQVAMLAIDGVAGDELAVAGGTDATSYFAQFLRQLDAVPATLWSAAGAVPANRLWRFQRKAGADPVLAWIGGASFFMGVPTAAGMGSGIPWPGVAVGASARMTTGYFDGGGLARVIVYDPGQATARTARVDEPSPGAFAWGPVTTLTFPQPVELLVGIPRVGGARLGVLSADGMARIYDFDGTTLTLRSTLAGSGHALLLPLGNDSLLSLNQDGLWQRWSTAVAPAVLTPLVQGSLPAAVASDAVSNVLFANSEPFADPGSTPVYFSQAGDWTLEAAGGGGGWTISALSEGPTGLTGPSAFPHGAIAGATHVLANQVRADVSIRFLLAAAGPPLADVVFSPEGGTFPQIVAGQTFPVTLAATAPGAEIRYRLGSSGAWSAYLPAAPPALASDSTVSAYARFSDGRQSPVRSATYVFAPPPPLAAGPSVDSDGDTLPDQWEASFQAGDPAADSDEDGLSNYGEYHFGTDPQNAADTVVIPMALAATLAQNAGAAVFRLEWPLSDAASRLQQAGDLGTWTAVTQGLSVTTTHHRFEVPLAGAGVSPRFFRLMRP
jgi:hypothetical protein